MAQAMDILTTRAVVRRRFALLDPAGFCPTIIPGWPDATVYVVTSPEMGANFAAYVIDVPPGGATDGALVENEVQRFCYALEGEADVHVDERLLPWNPGSFVYMPPGSALKVENRTARPARFLLFRRRHDPHGERAPWVVAGHVEEVAKTQYMDLPTVALQYLLPPDVAFDLMVNVFTFEPGASHTLVETHWEQHGALMLAGQGMYYLDDAWYPVKAGDFIWMGPYVPQAFYATGQVPARYIYTKDAHRDPKL